MQCDFCDRAHKRVEAIVDGKTILGMWAGMCDRHFKLYGIGLGRGRGQLVSAAVVSLEFPRVNPLKYQKVI